MKLVCMHCGKSFEGDTGKFCSQSCKDAHMAELTKKIHEAVNDDPSHTERFSKD